jgi:hypothetical protein
MQAICCRRNTHMYVSTDYLPSGRSDFRVVRAGLSPLVEAGADLVPTRGAN